MRGALDTSDSLVVERGNRADWLALAPLHYRSASTGPVAAIFRAVLGGRTVGVAVYAYPALHSSVRNRIFEGRYRGRLTARERRMLLNREIRTLRRVAVDPRHRRRGIAARLIRETLPQLGVPFVECVSAAAAGSRFLEDAGFVNAGSTLAGPPYYIWQRSQQR
jgi:GNAT superfamily N-acetyltransferase